jgi:hypothetical protein
MAVILAVLYFGLMELMMIDSSRALAEARRFRARIVAQTLAENGAELAAQKILTGEGKPNDSYTDEQGTAEGTRIPKAEGIFELRGTGVTSGTVVARAEVVVTGRVTPSGELSISFTTHKP